MLNISYYLPFLGYDIIFDLPDKKLVMIFIIIHPVYPVNPVKKKSLN